LPEGKVAQHPRLDFKEQQPLNVDLKAIEDISRIATPASWQPSARLSGTENDKC